MGLSMPSMYDYSTSDKEFNMEEEQDIAMILALHKNKQPKYNGFVFGRERLRRAQIVEDQQLMDNYFLESPVFPKRCFPC
jgi:hypothetical protein